MATHARLRQAGARERIHPARLEPSTSDLARSSMTIRPHSPAGPKSPTCLRQTAWPFPCLLGAMLKALAASLLRELNRQGCLRLLQTPGMCSALCAFPLHCPTMHWPPSSQILPSHVSSSSVYQCRCRFVDLSVCRFVGLSAPGCTLPFQHPIAHLQ